MKYGLKNQIEVTKKCPMVEIIQVDSHLIGPDHSVVVDFGIRLLGKKFLFIAVFDACWAGNTWAELKNTTVIALKLVGIARHVWTRTNKTHLPDEYVDQLGEAVHFAVA